MSKISKYIEDYLEGFIIDVQNNMIRQDKIASKKAFNSLETNILTDNDNEFHATVTGVSYFDKLETGNPPKSLGGGVDIPRRIFSWAKYKGLEYKSDEGRRFVFNTFRKINEFGDTLYREGGSKTIYTPEVLKARSKIPAIIRKNISLIIKDLKIN